MAAHSSTCECHLSIKLARRRGRTDLESSSRLSDVPAWTDRGWAPSTQRRGSANRLQWKKSVLTGTRNNGKLIHRKTACKASDLLER